MSQAGEGTLEADERVRAELLEQIREVNARIQQKIAALIAHPNVPQRFKDKLEELSGAVK